MILSEKAGAGDLIQADPGAVTRQAVLSAQAQITPQGDFEILAISVGKSNGWEFGTAALQESLPLWEGVECFLDHGEALGQGRSLRDLAGVCYNPAWDKDRHGIRAQLRAVGPAAEMLRALGREMLGAGTRPDVGFSADVIFTARGKLVEKILRVVSLDLVYNPARGGEFIRSLNQRKEQQMEGTMKANGWSAEVARLYQEQLKGSPGEQEVKAATRVDEERQELSRLRLEISERLLETALCEVKLPRPAAERIRRQFSGKIFETAELQAALDDARCLVSELTGSAAVQGPRVSGMVVTEERLQAAVDDLLGAPREKGMEALRVERLSGIRELYMMLTGDYDLHGGYYHERARLATTSDFSGLVKNALNKIVINQWEMLGRAGYNWWQSVATVEHFNSLNSITGTLVGTVGDLPAVLEGAEYTELAIGDSPETASFVKYGGYIPLTLELIDRDLTRKLAAYPRELANASMRKISKLVAAVFTDSNGIGPTMADGGALFNATAVTGAGGHANLLTTALSSSEWEVVSKAMYNQPMLVKQAAGYYGTGSRVAINPRYLLVPRALRLTAMQILYPQWESASQIFTDNMQRGEMGDVVVVPEWTDATDWAAVVDPLLAPAVFVGERFGLTPEIYISGDELSPAVFTNDEHRLKIRHFLAVWVNDFRPLHKSNVA